MAGYSVTFSVVDQATAQIEAINRRMRQMREPMERQAKALRQFVDLTGLKKVSEGFEAIARSAGVAFESMVRLVPVMGAVTGAASLAGLAALTRGWADFGQQLAVDSTKIGTTEQELQQLQDATTLAGGSSSDMTESLKGLTEGLSRAQLGDQAAASWFRRANIALRDTNGNLRTSTEVLPEVIQYLESLKDPMDRARVAAGLGSQRLADLAEQFERSGRTMPQWLAEARKFAPMTQEQAQAVQRYEQAVGGMTVAFEHLKEGIGAALGEALTPLIKRFGDWVRDNQPQIIAAVQQLANSFAQWLQNVDWSKVQQGAKDLLNAVILLAQNIDKVGTAAEVVAGIFAAKWAIGIGGAILSVNTALGGLLGPLAAVAALSLQIYQHWDEITKAGQDLAKNAQQGFGRVQQNLQDWWQGKPSAVPPPAVPGYPGATPAPGAPGTLNVPGYGNVPNVPGPARPPPALSNAPLPPEAKALLATIRQTESNLGADAYTETYGGGHKTLAPGEQSPLIPIRSGPNAGQMSSAYGAYQFINKTWEAEAKKLGLTDRSPESQDRAAWDLAETTYQQKTGRDLRSDIKAGRYAEVGAALHGQWTSLPGGIEQAQGSTFNARFARNVERAQGPPAQLAGNAANGSVDVTVTHRNPPPGASVTATSSGEGVNLSPPRVERQQLSTVS